MAIVSRFSRQERESHVSENLERVADTYLQTVSKSASDSTFLSHQTTLTKLVEWCNTNSIKGEDLREERVVEFITHLLSNEELGVDTVLGHVSSLANFLSYLFYHDPELVKIRIATHLQQKPSSNLQAVSRQITNIPDRETSIESVEALLSYLRQRQFGTRTHAYVEILQDTRSQPEQVRQLDLSEVSLCENTVTIGIPDSYVVKTVGLVTERPAELSSTTIEAVKTYIDYERNEGVQTNFNPLFTTTRGRASSSTLRRSIRQASEAAANYSSIETTSEASLSEAVESNVQFEPVVPNAIRQYSITTTLEEQ